MSATPYLPTEQIFEIADAAMEADLADQRRLLFIGITPQYRNFLPSASGPYQQMLSDLSAMNQVERLVDTTVPLQQWLENARRLTRAATTLAVFDHALDMVIRKATGEPDVAPVVFTGETKEEIIFRDDTVPFLFMQGGDAAGRAVARIKVPPYQGGAPQPQAFPHAGTGWLIAPRLLVTNHHVVTARSRTGPERMVVDPADLQLQAQNSTCRFDYLDDESGTEEVSGGALLASDEALDYAVLRLADGRASPETVLRVATEPLKVAKDQPVAVNVIQHPGGAPKRIGLRNNLVYEADDRDLRYFTDTRAGSSGSPVLTDDWTVVALHRGARRVEDVSFQGKNTAFVNVGTQVSSVLRHLRQNSPEVHAEITAAQAALAGQG
ncbi:trypsin-like peptidase domain-containing protein [Streptomyces aureus]|uniref:trypsin-like peptidase domain-containing protein n=1 Tax=Streptomyces aureus TaxID=193461 RepID=UPI0006E3B2CE|nr:trypsin-like peptidase domain-containing protein [Streptomyces aureus]